MPKLSDREKVLLLRAAGVRVGHTDGEPLSNACVTLSTEMARPWGIYKLSEILELLDLISQNILLGAVSKSDEFVIELLRANAILQGFMQIGEAEDDNSNQEQTNNSGER